MGKLTNFNILFNSSNKELKIFLTLKFFAGRRLVFLDGPGREVVHGYVVATADHHELYTESQEPCAVLDDCKLLDRHELNHNVLVCFTRLAARRLGAVGGGLAQVAAVLRHGHLRSGRNRRREYFAFRTNKLLLFFFLSYRIVLCKKKYYLIQLPVPYGII